MFSFLYFTSNYYDWHWLLFNETRLADSNKVIFLGELVKVEDLDKTPIGKLAPYDIPIKYTFTVNEMIKGADVSTIDVYTNQPDKTCSYVFEKGEKYLVHGMQSLEFQEYVTNNWSFKTAHCMGNTQRRYTEKKKLDLLRKLAK